MKSFHVLTTAAVYYFLTAQQAFAAGTGGAGLAELEQPVSMLASTMTGSIATDLTAVGGVVGAFMWANSDHGPGTRRAGAWIAGGAMACNIVPIMNTLGFAGAVM